MVDSIEKRGINIPIKHVSNSAATIDLPDLNFNMVRCGIVYMDIIHLMKL